MRNYKAVHIVFEKPEEADIISALLSVFPFEGFEEKQNLMIGYIPASALPAEKRLKAALNHFSFHIEDVENTNWNKLWESNYPSVQLAQFCGIRADFHPHFETVKYEITINPRMSFGTGHHATTKLMMRMMEELEVDGKRVLDFGTGTGVLAILADKMGAQKVIAVENDPDAVANAKDNMVKNEASSVNIYHRDNASFLDESFAIVLANITKNIILKNADGLWNRLEGGGLLILSGLLEKDVKPVSSCFLQKNAVLERTLEEEEWRGLQFRKPRR